MRGDAEKGKRKVALNNLIYTKYLVGEGTVLGGKVAFSKNIT